MTFAIGQSGNKPRPRAFTLIELILVMAVIAIAVSIVVPRLAMFFRGRAIDSEARQLLALAHAGQSRAVSDGIPTRLWVDAKGGKYGLEEDPGFADQDPKAEEFALDQNLKIEVPDSDASAPAASMNASPLGAKIAAGPHGGLPAIRFLADGTIDETSPRTLRLMDGDGATKSLTQTRNRLQYEIQE